MSTSLRILLLTPGALPQVSGNAVTAERWRRGLTALGHAVRVVPTAELTLPELAAQVREFRPHLVHAHHAFKSGCLVLAAGFSHLPLVVSTAGTDLSQDLHDPERGGLVRRVLQAASRIVVQSDDAARRVGAELPEGRSNHIVTVPKSLANLGDEPWDLRAACGVGSEHLLFLHPAGVRPVKGNLQALRGLTELQQQRPQVRAVFLGPPLDPAYATRFGAAVAAAPFARWLPGVAPSCMPAAYRAADAVLNTSGAEGFANVLLEAAAAGVPVLASDIPSNRSAVVGNSTIPPGGLLYDPDTPDAFLRQALRLVDDPELRVDLGRGGLARARQLPPTTQEAEALVGVYGAALAGEGDAGDG